MPKPIALMTADKPVKAPKALKVPLKIVPEASGLNPEQEPKPPPVPCSTVSVISVVRPFATVALVA